MKKDIIDTIYKEGLDTGMTLVSELVDLDYGKDILGIQDKLIRLASLAVLYDKEKLLEECINDVEYTIDIYYKFIE